jgi:hypothetical protein
VPSAARIRGSANPESRPAGFGARPPAHAWGALDRDRRLAAIAALALFVAMFLPWYQQNAVVSAAKTQPLVSRNLDAFQVFSFVEAAVLLVAVAVLFLLYARAQGRDFRLPGGDGAVVLAAGLWSALLLVLRLFDKPGVTQHGVAANVGIQWGIFFALAAAGLLAYAGSRMRAAQRPEPPLLRRWPIDDRSIDDRPPPGEPPPREPPRPESLRRDTPPRPPPEEEPTVVARRKPVAYPKRSAPRTPPVPAKPRGRGWADGRTGSNPPGEEQLSLEDPPL